MKRPRIVIAGAGAVGAYIGGLLAAAGRDAVLLGRPWLADEVSRHGLTLTDVAGHTIAARPETATDPAILAGADLILVCVKSGATADMARLIADNTPRSAPNSAPVISLQNGVRNADLLRRSLPGRDIRGGMVGFNVVALGDGRFHRSTSGELMIQDGPGDLARLLSTPTLPVTATADIAAVQWGKLLLNLTNAVNALSGLPLRDMLLTRGWRRVMAAQMAEALAVLKAARTPFKVPAAAPARAIPLILRLPTGLFRRIAAPMLTVDPAARTSMVADLAARRPTEIDEFQGEILRLAAAHGLPAPFNARVFALIRAAEADGLRPLTPSQVLAPGVPP